MPRQSRASLALVPLDHFDGRLHRLRPPHDLSKDAKALWVELVSGSPPDHFKQTDMPLLRQYVTMVLLAERAERELQHCGPISEAGHKWFSVHQRAVRSMAVLSMRLRLAPSTRMGARTAGRAAEHHPPMSYYEIEAAQRE